MKAPLVQLPASLSNPVSKPLPLCHHRTERFSGFLRRGLCASYPAGQIKANTIIVPHLPGASMPTSPGGAPADRLHHPWRTHWLPCVLRYCARQLTVLGNNRP